jgi:hypothetical protein
MSNRLKDWFNEPIGLHQSVARTLPVMALTVTDPAHPDAYRGNSCYGQCALALREMKNNGVLSDDYSIVIFGLPSGTVFHTVLAKRGTIILDTEHRENEGNLKVSNTHSYHHGGSLTLLKEISVRDFERDYVSKVTIPPRPYNIEPKAGPT